MEKLLTWIIEHKKMTIFIAILTFLLPLVIVHGLFLWDPKCPQLNPKWEAGDMILYVAGFEAFLGTVALGALALWQNQQIHNQHIDSLEPILSMKLVSYKHILYLVIENTGACEAKEIKINIDNVENIGNAKLEHSFLDGLFKEKFELYPHEIVQGRITPFDFAMATEKFPKILVSVSYTRPDINRKKEYSRTVIYNGGYAEKLAAEVNIDNNKIEKELTCAARALVRTANYLDGYQVGHRDELDILSNRSFQNDLASVMDAAKKEKIFSHAEIMEHCAENKTRDITISGREMENGR